MSVVVLATHETPLAADVAASWLAELPAQRRMALQRHEPWALSRSLLALRLLRLALRRFGHGPEALRGLQYPATGKPRLALRLDFSLAHGGGWVICAASPDTAVGVDVEALGDIDARSFRIYLSDAERAWAGADPRRFCTLWTRKEAVLKAAGGAGLRELPRIALDDNGGWFDGVYWHTTELAIADGVVAHLASRSGDPAPAIERVAFETLM